MGELTVRSVRNGLSDYVGSRVQVKSNLGRRKYDILEGVIKDLYPCIFTIEVDGKDDKRCSIAVVLKYTGHVEFFLCMVLFFNRKNIVYCIGV